MPKQLKIISFSNLPTAALLNPALSTLTQPAFSIGKEAALLLFQSIKKDAHRFTETSRLSRQRENQRLP